MKVHFSRFSRLAMVALLAGSIQAKAETETIVPIRKVEALAACKTLAEEINAKQGVDKVSNAGALADLCDKGIASTFEQLRLLGSEYFFGGVGFFVSVEGNIPVKTLALGARGAFGGAMFMTDNVGPRFTPMINAVPLALQKTWKEAPSPVEFQYGLIFYIGGKNVKSINQFNGLYIGGGLEVPKVGSSEMANRSSASGALLYNVQTGTYAAVIMKSLNAGSHMVAINTQIMYVNNLSRTGGGAKVSDIYSGTLNEISQRFSDASESLSNYVGSWTGSKN